MSSPERLLGYGAANVGNLFRALSDDEAWQVLDAAWESGIRSFDTAPHYGLGLSERRLGAFLQTKPREEFTLSTKVGRLLRPNPDDDGGLDLDNDFHVPTTLRREWDFSAEGIAQSLAESRERLGIDEIDILYLHDPERHDLDLAIRDALPALEALRSAGEVREVGVGSMVGEALSRSVREASLDVVMVAGRYTLLEQAEDVRMACRETSTDMVIASVFNSGLLASREPSRDGRYEYGGVPEEIWQKLERIVAVCRAHDVSLPAAAIQFPFLEERVRTVVVGSSRPTQIRENVELAGITIPADFWAELRDAGLIPQEEI